MDKSLAIVKVDTRHYRFIAQENWGLTKEQMQGKHVHHRIKRCEGGTNDPSNLYVCSPSYHRWCWHNGEEFIEWAAKGGALGGKAQPREVKRQNALKGIKTKTKEQRQKAGRARAAATNKYMSLERKREIIKIMQQKTPREVRVKAGRKVWEEKLGAFAMSPEDRRAANIKGGQIGGKKAQEMGVGLAAMTREQRAEASSKGGKNRTHEDSVKAGKISAHTLWEDPDHPEIGKHNAGNLVQKQRALGYPCEKENRRRAE